MGKSVEDTFIRIRVCLAVVNQGRILLVPHYSAKRTGIQWVVPGGGVGFGESLEAAAAREFLEETGLQAGITELLDVSEIILREKPYHSITVSYAGRITGGTLRPEPGHPFGEKTPRWFSAADLISLQVHPKSAVLKALDKAPPDTEPLRFTECARARIGDQ